jgi:hypothetical protein
MNTFPNEASAGDCAIKPDAQVESVGRASPDRRRSAPQCP